MTESLKNQHGLHEERDQQEYVANPTGVSDESRPLVILDISLGDCRPRAELVAEAERIGAQVITHAKF